MLTLVEELMLLVLDDETGKIQPLPVYSLEYASGGAVLLDLALRDKIDCDLEKVTVVDDSPTEEPVLDPVLEHLAAAAKPRGTKEWLVELSRMPEIRQRALDQLVERRILRCEDQKFLWVFGTRRYPVVDGREEREVKRRIMEIIYSDEIPLPRDAILVSLVKACSLFPSILDIREVNATWNRIQKVAGLDLMARQILDCVESLQAAVHRGRS
jgi:Golgi phosphoprotein 3